MHRLREVARRAEELYNRYRAPEAVAKVLKVDNGRIVVQFTGSFCHTCGLYNWLEDMKYVLEDLGVDTCMEKAEEVSNGTWIAIFKLSQSAKRSSNE